MSGKTVLVVEDEILIRFDIVDALSEAGFTVLEAGNVAEAVALGAYPDIRAVFTDVDMPGNEDGLDLAQRVHADFPPVAVLVNRSLVAGRGRSPG
jgi:DNA-binding response OmpR family regulator